LVLHRDFLRRVGLGHECVAGMLLPLQLKLLVDVRHRDRNRLVQLFDLLVARLEFALNPPNSQLEQLVLPLRFDNLRLKEVFVLLKGMRSGHPVLDFVVEFLLFLLHLDPLLVEAVHLLIEFVDRFVLQRVVAVLGVQLLDQGLQLFLLCFDVDRVPLEVVVLLLLQLSVQFYVQVFYHVVQLPLGFLDLRLALKKRINVGVPLNGYSIHSKLRGTHRPLTVHSAMCFDSSNLSRFLP